MKFPHLPVLTLMIALSVSMHAQDSVSTQVGILTLEQSIALAKENNRQIKISYQNVLQTNDQILATRTQRYPQFSAQLTGSYLLTPITVSFPGGIFGDVNGTPVPTTNSLVVTEPKPSGMSLLQAYQPLSQLYNIRLNLESLQVSKKLSQEQLRQQQQQIVNSVKDTYYSMLQTQSSLDAAQDNVKSLLELDRITGQNLKEKTALPYQSTSVKAQLAQAELQVVTLQDTLSTQKENLNSLMGRDIRTEFRLSGVPEALPEEMDLEMARKSALDNRTEIRQAKMKIEQAIYARRIQKSQYIPQIGLQFLYFSPFAIEGLPQSVSALGLTMNWDLYDWGNKRHLLAQKDRIIEQNQLNLTETQSQVLIDIDNNFRKLRQARANVKVAQLGQQAEKEKLQVVTEQYKQKTVLLSTALSEQATMAQATAQYQQALAAFWTAKSDFMKSLGED